jgi:transcriptional regulator with XRE-family HTH domain
MIASMELLRHWLTETGKTQAQFADDLGVSQPTVSDWLNGHMLPSAGKLLDISKRTGISVDRLLGAEPQRKSARRKAS